jgi:hypothetical protein
MNKIAGQLYVEAFGSDAALYMRVYFSLQHASSFTV